MSDQTPISLFPWWPNLSAWVGIDPEALTHRIIEVLLREENNLIQVTEDNELYVDLQLPNWVAPTDDFPVGVTTWSVQAVDGRPYTGTLLHYETTSWDYCQWLRGNNGNLYFDWGDGTWKQVYYADQVLALLDEYIRRRDFYWNAEVIDSGTITLSLSTTVTPNANFQVLPPTEVKDGQTYILRVNNEATVYNMSLSPLIYNPHQVDLSLTPNMIDMFVFLGVNGSLELQPMRNGIRSMFKTQDEYDALPASKTTDGNLYIIVDTHIEPQWLCFKAEEAHSTIKLINTSNYNAYPDYQPELEISTDGVTWTAFNIEYEDRAWDTITLQNIWDKVYMRNVSETPTEFSLWDGVMHRFKMTGTIAVSGDIWYLLCKNSTTTLSWSFWDVDPNWLFSDCPITTTPSLPATSIRGYAYTWMFSGCTKLTTIPALPATALHRGSYSWMFAWSSIKLSETQDDEYTQPYRIPVEWNGTDDSDFPKALKDMFNIWTPEINRTYYLHKNIRIV